MKKTYTREDIQKHGVEAFAIAYWEKEQKQSIKFADADALRRIENIEIGKMAEFFVAEYLGEGEPDLGIYPTGTVMPEGDLIVGSARVHVKTAEAGMTWLVALDDKAKTNPTTDDMFVFCKAQTGRLGSVEITIIGAILATEITDEYWGKPKRLNLWGKKAALYWDGTVTATAKQGPIFTTPLSKLVGKHG